MKVLNTFHPTMVYDGYIIDPSIMDQASTKKDKKRNVQFYDYKESNHNLNFIRDVTSGFLEMNGFNHNKNKWYMDVIHYNLENDVQRVKSGLAWHCENDNYPDVITVLMYLTIDDGIKEGNVRYKDINGGKQILQLKSGLTVIMDGNVPHKPQDPYGTGKRDLIIMSFEKIS